MSRKTPAIEKAYARNLGAWLRETRKKIALTQAQLGRAIGVNANTIWHWEHGVSMPSVYHYSLIKRLVNKTEAAQ